mgnify:CR=1 FL=1
MNSKDIILDSLRSAGAEQFPRPDLSSIETEAMKYDDIYAQFCAAVKGLWVYAADSLAENADAVVVVHEDAG